MVALSPPSLGRALRMGFSRTLYLVRGRVRIRGRGRGRVRVR